MADRLRSLRLRPLGRLDEPAFRAGHEAMKGDGFSFGLDGFDTGTVWEEYLQTLADRARGIGVPGDRVPATFVVADVGGEIVGRASVRHRLNEWLLREGGHIGYGVLPPCRRQGHATEILLQSLVIARSVGVDRVLVVCDEGNIGSSTVIERCGGVVESVVPAEDGHLIRRYWVD